MDFNVLALANKYTDETVIGGGAIKGKNCTIEKTEVVEGGTKITFLWTLDDGTQKRTAIVVLNGNPGEQGDDGVGIESMEADENVLVITLTDGTEERIPIPTVSANALDDLSDVEIDSETLASGQILKWNGEKWVNAEGGGGGDASLSVDVTSNLAVGAIPSGTKLLAGTSFTEFVQKLLITEVAPTINFSISKSGNVVYGGSYTETLTLAVSAMGSAKKIKSIAWYEGNTLKQTDTIDSAVAGSWTYTMPTATTDTTTFKAVVTYTKSDDSDTSVTKTASINFYYNKFYGAVADLNPTEVTVEALSTALGTGKGGTYSFTVTAGRICYAYPKSLGALTSIKDGNGFSLFDSFTRTEQTYTQNGTSVPYYRYVLTDATTVSGYSVTFA